MIRLQLTGSVLYSVRFSGSEEDSERGSLTLVLREREILFCFVLWIFQVVSIKLKSYKCPSLLSSPGNSGNVSRFPVAIYFFQRLIFLEIEESCHLKLNYFLHCLVDTCSTGSSNAKMPAM